MVQYDAVMFMNNTWKLYLWSAFIAVVVPMMIVSILSKSLKPGDTEIEGEMIEQDSGEEDPVRVSVLMTDGAVGTYEIEEYLVGVVLCEMPADFEFEALKAQAVVARTYTLRRQQNDKKHQQADVCTDSGCCQGYITKEQYIKNGGKQESIDKIQSAVEETASQVLYYNGTLIEATYFSCSGGMTENAAAVWGGTVPYLLAKESPGEEGAAYYTETIQLTTTDFCNKLGRNLEGNPGTWIQSVTYTDGGGVDFMRICGVDYKGTELRTMLGLRSTAFIVSIVGNTVTITTKGFGHRVGMSQYGADAMAVNGSNYEEILLYYYTGVTLGVY